MSKREVIQPHGGDKRYARRDEKGEFTNDQVKVGKSLAAGRGEGVSRAISCVPVFHLFFTGDGSRSRPRKASRAKIRSAGPGSGEPNPLQPPRPGGLGSGLDRELPEEQHWRRAAISVAEELLHMLKA
jgi:hypothetical protein